MAKSQALLPLVQQILWREWDPIGVNDNPQAINEYDSYAPHIVSLLTSGVDEYKLARHLRELQRVAMGMSVIDEQLHQRVARRLLDLLAR